MGKRNKVRQYLLDSEQAWAPEGVPTQGVGACPRGMCADAYADADVDVGAYVGECRPLVTAAWNLATTTCPGMPGIYDLIPLVINQDL